MKWLFGAGGAGALRSGKCTHADGSAYMKKANSWLTPKLSCGQLDPPAFLCAKRILGLAEPVHYSDEQWEMHTRGRLRLYENPTDN